MDLKEVKKITRFARDNGIKSLEFNGFKVEFHDAALFPKTASVAAALASKPTLVPDKDPGSRPAPAKEATLDDINAFIYQSEDVG